MTDDWDIISDKVTHILSERFHEVRKDISADEILERVTDSLKPVGVSMNVSGLDIDMSTVAELFQKYNDSHRERILKLANLIGQVVDEKYIPDEHNILVEVQKIRISIVKEVALKISALGFLPEST